MALMPMVITSVSLSGPPAPVFERSLVMISSEAGTSALGVGTQARESIRSKGLYGPVSVDVFDGARLPYVDNLVNLIVIQDYTAPAKELMRVLAPGGVVCHWLPLYQMGFEDVRSVARTFSEVFDGFVNMPGGVADTLLALVWTQYQYFFFPLIFGYFGYKLLLEDWRQSHKRELSPAVKVTA